MTSPWYISARAVRDFAVLCGVRNIPDEGPVWDRYERDLMRIAQDAAERKTPKRTQSGLLAYRVRKPVDVQVLVSDGPRPEGELPQLVDVVAGYRRGR